MPNDVSAEQASRWDLLTQTGAGTPMGELLRRYWWPIAGASEFEQPGA
jgi:5,5'-dehydrodivanillate O-demethylase